MKTGSFSKKRFATSVVLLKFEDNRPIWKHQRTRLVMCDVNKTVSLYVCTCRLYKGVRLKTHFGDMFQQISS